MESGRSPYWEGQTGELLAWAARALVGGREEDAVCVLADLLPADLERPLADDRRAAVGQAAGKHTVRSPRRAAHLAVCAILGIPARAPICCTTPQRTVRERSDWGTGMISVLNPQAGWRLVWRSARGRLLGSYAALVFVLLLGLSAAFSSTQVLRTHFTHTVNTVDALATTEAQVAKLLDDEETGLRGYLLTGDAAFLTPYSAAVRALPALQTRAGALLSGDGRALLSAQQRDERAWQVWAAPLLRQPAARVRAAPGFVATMLQGKALFDRLRRSSDRLMAYLAAARAWDLQESLTADRQSGGALFWVLIVTLGLVALVGWLTSRDIMGSLSQLARAATAIGRGDLNRPIAVAGAVEFARLGEHMDRMRRQLRTQRAMAELLASSLHLEPIWAGFAAEVRAVVPFDRLSLNAIDGDGITMTTLYAEGVASDRSAAGTRRAIAATSTSLLEPDQHCLILPDLAALPGAREFEDVRGGLAEGLRSKALVQLRANGQLIGGLHLGSRQVGAFSEEQLGPILALAPLMGAALENARLYASLEEVNGALGLANRELEAFAYSVSHDLRAPLRSIAGFSQALLEDYAGVLDAEGTGYLTRVIEGSRSMGQLIDDLLGLARVSRADLQRRETDLSDLARSVVAELAQREPERTVEVAIAEGLVVHGDGRLLRVALDNLLGNAWKFTRHTAQARIEVGTTVREGRPAYFVRDNGAGFEMAYAHKLFGAFQRLHSVEEFEGTGIGLATVQRIIHRHGGKVWAEGAVGHGATISFTL